MILTRTTPTTVACAIALAAILAPGLARPAGAELLLDAWKQVDDVIVFDDSDPESGRCYYMPKARIGRRADGLPDLTFLKYTKTSGGDHLNGGILRFTVGLGLEPEEVARIESERPDCTSVGPVPFKSGDFMVVSAAVGEGGVFNRNIVGEGSAPLVSNSRAAVSIAVTPEGATFLENALRDTNHGVDVVFDMTYSGLTKQYEARAEIDWDKVRRFTESDERRRVYSRRELDLGVWKHVWYVQEGEDREQRLTDYLRSNGTIVVERVGQDEDLDAILQTLTDQVMNVIADVQLSLPEGEGAGGEGSDDGEEGEGGGGDGSRYGSRVSLKSVSRRGTATIELRSRQRQDRDTGPIAADLGGPLRRHSSDRRVYRLIDLDDPDFQAQTVSATLDIEGFDSFGDYINYATVTFRKRYRDPERSDHTGTVSFNRKSFQDSGNVLEWTFPRLGEEGSSWLRYEYKETWSFAGGVRWESGWTSAESPYLALSPPLKLRSLDLAIDPERAAEDGVRLVRVAIRNRVAGQERLREVRVDPQDGTWSEHRYYHAEGDPSYSYRITWYLEDGRERSEWRTTTDSYIDLNHRG